MAWYEEAVFYHIYPLGITGAPKQNSYGEPVHRLRRLWPWIGHIRQLGCTAIYIGPLFESVGHGYETTDYRKLDSRLGTNEDLTAFVKECHRQGLRVIFDGVFNHTGRDFFAFRDLKEHRESSPYRDWYCNVNFWGNNEYNDGFSYENWGGYNLLVKLNQRNPAVRDYICDVIRFWVSEFDVDGIRLDAADVLDFDFMKALRWTAEQVKPDFWLMGEVIHGDYSRWANAETLHSVTNYMMHKALYSGHNDHNYFEIAHTIRHIDGMTGSRQYCRSLYQFVDNHDVERISTKLVNKAHYVPVHILLYTLPGIPSIYYGSEFGVDGEKHRGGPDDAIRPSIRLEDFAGLVSENESGACQKDDGTGQENNLADLPEIQTTCHVAPGLDPKRTQALIRILGSIRRRVPALSFGDYEQRVLTTRQYAFVRRLQDQEVVIAVNNDDHPAKISIPARDGNYIDALSGVQAASRDGRLQVCVPACSGQIWVPGDTDTISGETGAEAVNRQMASPSSTDQMHAVGATEPEPIRTADAQGCEQTPETAAAEPGPLSVTGSAVQGQKPETAAAGQGCTTDAWLEGPGRTPAVCSEDSEQTPAADTAGTEPAAATEGHEHIPAACTEASGQAAVATGTKPVTAAAAAGAGSTPAICVTKPGQTSPIDVTLPTQEEDPNAGKEEAIEIPDCPYEEMSVPQLQQVILGKLAANGPVTDQMKREVSANIWKDSLLNWAKSFR